MSNAADRIRASALAVRASNTRPTAPHDESTDMPSAATPKTGETKNTTPDTAAGVFTPRQKPVRRTVDLTPDQHDQLDMWQRRTAREIGRARVTGQQVLNSLVAQLLDDPDLARLIRDRIHRDT